jgi:hypothetical protein
LSNCDDEALECLVDDSVDGDEDFRQTSNAAFNVVGKEDIVEATVENLLDNL